MEWPFRRRRRALPATNSEPRFRNPYFAGPPPEKAKQRATLELSALGLVFTALLFVALFSPAIFGLTTIEVHGNERLSVETIQKTVIESLSRSSLGLLPRSNVLMASTTNITATLRFQYALDEARVQRRLPHTLIITIKESYPAFALQLDAESAALMTRQGSVAEVFTDLEKLQGYPVIKLAEPISTTPGEKLLTPTLSDRIPELSEKLRSSGLAFSALFLESPACPTVPLPPEEGTNTNRSTDEENSIANTNTELSDELADCNSYEQIKRAEDVRIELEAGYALLVSTSEDIDRQIQKYQTFTSDEPDTVVREYVDLRVPGRIYFK
jgi:cell division septal protein FtsQ